LTAGRVVTYLVREVTVTAVRLVRPDQTSGVDRYTLAPSDPSWPELFAGCRDVLRAALGPLAVRIDHVGSTAVPGLVARPVVDIQVSVADVDAEEDYREALLGAGFELVDREPDRRVFARTAPPYDAEVYVCRSGGAWEFDRLLSVAYLTACPPRRDAYAALKTAMLADERCGEDEYVAAKHAFLMETVRLAQRWLDELGERVSDQAD
jgi:GrpB-like predicted nucleotidyltransferase (UPF0157 family)